MASQVVEKHWDKWLASNENEGIILLEHNTGGRKIQFLSGDEEFEVSYPADYPASSTGLKISTESKKLGPAVDRVSTELLQKKPANAVTMIDLLKHLIAANKKRRKQTIDYEAEAEEEAKNASDEDGSAKESDEEPMDDDEEMPAGSDDDVAMDDEGGFGGDYDDGLTIKDEELELLKKKKRWRQKEEQIRAQMRLTKAKSSAKKVDTIFTSSAATGVLTNDLLTIMQNSKTLGYTAKPVDDNIYEWEELIEIQKKHGYDHVDLRVSFKMDLYPFYPPLVKLIRPRFKGFMMGRVTSLEMFKLQHWDPIKDMRYTIGVIRQLLEAHGQIDIATPMNDSDLYPTGAYTELEYLLLELELVCDKDPRANFKYPPPDWKKKEQPATTSTSSNAASPAPDPNKGKAGQEYWARGTGYGHDSAGSQTWNVQAYLAAQKERDNELERVLDRIRQEILKTTDLNPQFMSSTYLVLEESCLVPVLEQYCDNDSFLDMTRHLNLYTTIYGLVRAIADNKHFAGLLDKLEFQRQSILELCSKVHQQASIYLRTIKAAGSTTTKSDQDTLVQDADSTYAAVKKAVEGWRQRHGTMVTASAGQIGLTGDPLTDNYLKIMKTWQFGHCDFKGGKYPHHYDSQGATNHPRDQILRLAQESSSLSQSLPLNLESTVFARLDENQFDKMTAMITGPLETPYAGGCFLFDIFFPATYPNTPPLVNLQTTGNGSFRFNPNLYNTGKVCLSLLGTWSGAEGENWNKDTSTLLQVLVSIQSLILVPKPYFNEPGYERTMHTPEGMAQSQQYNEAVKEANIRFAMIDQLRNPKLGYEEVIKGHFYLLKGKIYAIIQGWIDDPKASSSHATKLRSLLTELKGLISALPVPAPKPEEE